MSVKKFLELIIEIIASEVTIINPIVIEIDFLESTSDLSIIDILSDFLEMIEVVIGSIIANETIAVMIDPNGVTENVVRVAIAPRYIIIRLRINTGDELYF